MADGTIVINSDLKTDKLKNKLAKLNNDIERQINKVHDLQREYDRLNDALSDARAKGAYINPEDVAATDQARLNLEHAQITLERMRMDAAGIQDELDDAESGTGLIQQNVEAAKKQLEHFEKRLKGVVKEVLIFTAFAATLRKMKSYIGEALSVNEGFQASLAKLKGTLRTAFQPILDFVIPILHSLIDILNTAMGYIARFTSWLFGTTVAASSKAAEALYEQANATKAAGAAAQKAKRQMSGLDEMNKWQSESSGGGGGSSGSATKIDFSNEPSKLPEGISKVLSVIKDHVLAIGAGLLAWKIAKKFTKSLKKTLGIVLAAAGAVELVKNGLDAWANGVNWDNLLGMLVGAAAITGGLALAFGSIGAAIGLAISGITLLVVGIKDWIETGELSTQTFVAIEAGILAIGAALAIVVGWPALVVAAIAAAALAIYKYWDEIAEFFTDTLNSIADFFVNTWHDIAEFFSSVLNGIKNVAVSVWDAVSGFFIETWETISEAAKKIWGNVSKWFKSTIAPKFTVKYWTDKFSSISSALTSATRAAVSGARDVLNRFIDWVNNKLTWNLGDGVIADLARSLGVPTSFRLFKIPRIPALAQGGVIPANHAFLSILGDQKQGMNIEAPEDLIRKIVREEAGAGNYTFIAQLDGRTIFKEVISQGKLAQRMTGKNAFKLGGA